jgi:hypothetical protein
MRLGDWCRSLMFISGFRFEGFEGFEEFEGIEGIEGI